MQNSLIPGRPPNLANVALVSVKFHWRFAGEMKCPCHLCCQTPFRLQLQTDWDLFWKLRRGMMVFFLWILPVCVKGWHSEWRLCEDIISATALRYSAHLNVVGYISSIKLHNVACFLVPNHFSTNNSSMAESADTDWGHVWNSPTHALRLDNGLMYPEVW